MSQKSFKEGQSMLASPIRTNLNGSRRFTGQKESSMRQVEMIEEKEEHENAESSGRKDHDPSLTDINQ